MPSNWFRSTSSLCRRSTSKYFTSSWCWPVIDTASCFNVTAHPTAEWTAQQLREAFPFAQLPRFLFRDRDTIFGNDFQEHVRDMVSAKFYLHRVRLGSEPI